MRHSIINRLQRLEILQARLKTGGPITVGQIAEELGVSVRTINRDIEILREQGLPIDADRGRGGGIRLHRQWGIGRVNLNYSEAVDLLVTLAIAEQMKSPLFMANLNGIRLKLMASFSPTMKTKVNQLKARILIGESASPFVLAHFTKANNKLTKKLHQAFLLQLGISIQYIAEDKTKTSRNIQVHYLLLCYPVWYALAWDELRQDIRTFRCDRIIKIQLLTDEFNLLPVSRFESALQGNTII